MTEITIDSTKQTIAVEVKSQSLHALGFKITVFASDGNTIIEKFAGDTKKNNPFTKTLAKKPSEYKGNFIRGIFTVISPDGKDSSYSYIFSILEDDNLVTPNIEHNGTTTNGKNTSINNYHIN